MNDLIKLLEKYNIADIFIILILVFLAVKGIMTEVNNIKTKIKKNKEEYHEEQSDKEEEKDRLTVLENKIEAIDDMLKSIKDCQMDIQKCQQKSVVATCRSSLQLLTDKVLEKGYMTQIEYETFDDLAEVYISNKGNHTMKDKIIPKVRQLPVYTEQELTNNKL